MYVLAKVYQVTEKTRFENGLLVKIACMCQILDVEFHDEWVGMGFRNK